MKYTYIMMLVLISSWNGIAQTKGVGIDTEKPTAMLDVNGELRVRQMSQVAKSDYVLTTDSEGNVKQIHTSDLLTAIKGKPKAEFIPYQGNPVSDRTPTLDLWTKQENGEEIKRYYFLGQQQRVTLPKNITSEGDNMVRRITFILIKNQTPDGFSSTFVGATSWDFIAQTKLYEVNADTYNGGDGGVCLHKATANMDQGFGLGMTWGEDLTWNWGQATWNPGVCQRRQVKFTGNIYAREREINFYDFGGKWIMTVNE